MAFPVINGTNKGNVATNGTSSTINMPTTGSSIVAGDRLFALVCVDENVGSAFTGWPAGWNSVFVSEITAAIRVECRYKEAAGGETAFALGHVLNMSAHATWKYQVGTFDAGTAPQANTATTSTATTLDPTALNPTAWDIEDTSWIVAIGYNTGTHTISGTPTGYVLIDGDRSSSTQGVGAFAYERDNAVASEDPGAFTRSTAGDWLAVVIATRPAAALTVAQQPRGAVSFMGSVTYV